MLFWTMCVAIVSAVAASKRIASDISNVSHCSFVAVKSRDVFSSNTLSVPA